MSQMFEVLYFIGYIIVVLIVFKEINMKFYGCIGLAELSLNFNQRIDSDNKAVASCCELLPDGAQVPAVSMEGSAEDILNSFINNRNSVIDYLKKEGNKARKIRKDEWLGCKRCASLQKKNWNVESSIKYVNFSAYPSPCQCKCIYCYASLKWENTPKVKQAYEKMFEVVELAEKRGIISADANWQVSSGEITIHPYKDRFLRIVKNKKVSFYTNAFIYDEDIAKILSKNRNSRINISIDAGTPQTWKKVKGIDNYKEVCENLVAYRKAALDAKQIEIKYIILPGINDSEADCEGLLNLLDLLDVSSIIFSRDMLIKYSNRREEYRLLKSAARLFWACLKNNINVVQRFYSSKELRKIRMIIRWNRVKNIFKRKNKRI